MNVARRLSPEILIDLLEYAQGQLNDFIKRLDTHGRALFPVSWAGESESQNWFDIAREYTEVWHHQMQIRMALGKPILLEPKYSEPLYDTFMLGLPHLFKDLQDFEQNYKVKISLSGSLNKSWLIERQAEKWVIIEEKNLEIIHTSLEVPDDRAWKVFTNTDRDKEKYKAMIKSTGDARFALRLLEYVTVMS